ncbi:MAG: winged helix-turn-helix transcriptional regulator [Theionarchaea archaeon]|nr:winged helix-turn-helix transcriptional regulator [Theionarchaea archaeon]MBU7000899.1 winged helix-turn-helix transcriptional regulator [Theionarchaea archaeon]MBU7019888.1 winged helix-turn-helix transcriptional regulator [Theionarchaea archaeon]MBU7035288.1 winged helix-turn-helix transcriptional regulator [Theionarchaea archaeon]MBU7040948.1 winged helix-turn-helix transcriptional regulator [Theionarchaea archaeon]
MHLKLKILKALSDETRLNILEFLRDGEKCVCEIVPYIGTSQSNVSQHLRILKDANVLTDRKEGKSIYYSVVDEDIYQCLDDLEGIAENAVKRLLEIY